MTTTAKGSKTQEMEAKSEAQERAILAAGVREEELEDQIVALEARNTRLTDKRSDALTDDVVLNFIKKKAEEFNPDKLQRGDRTSPARLRQICHLYNQLIGAASEFETASK